MQKIRAEFRKVAGGNKEKYLWNQLSKDKQGANWPNQGDEDFFFRKDLEDSFGWCSDWRPWPGNKFIHPIGAVAKIKFVPSGQNHQYTGLFKGADYGVARLSLTSKRNNNGIAPSIGIKFFRDGLPSANIVAMLWFFAQDTPNFFAHEFSNHAEPSNGINMDDVQRAFKEVDNDWFKMTGLSDVAATDQRGNAVSNLGIPFEVRFVANEALSNSWGDSDNQVSRLSQIPAGTVLYTVFGRDSPAACNWSELGNIVTKSEIIPSSFGDFELFFRHQPMEDDLKIHPEWVQHMKKGRRKLGSDWGNYGSSPQAYRNHGVNIRYKSQHTQTTGFNNGKGYQGVTYGLQTTNYGSSNKQQYEASVTDGSQYAQRWQSVTRYYMGMTHVGDGRDDGGCPFQDSN
eukprot:CAMPEP_0195512592 /NCGR_PEP_ID=MMETSP0794_2-20130614/4505_1 /TAXON_ID=515487 /ORGANISM="Stephanopyxis turris, Strain CCMP 815" /LENGTH=398 /DNA_ID=CAMNT_0040640415 /DNA_START=112 /DNA_END=1309 /DNA_ORIENTATION=+